MLSSPLYVPESFVLIRQITIQLAATMGASVCGRNQMVKTLQLPVDK